MRRAAAGVVLAVALTGCAGLPEHSPVQPGRPVDAPVGDGVRVTLYGPTPGAGARDIVLGFIRASVGIDDDPSVGRQFLTGDAAGQWAARGVLIYEDGTPPTVSVIGGTAIVVAPVTGSLDAEGHYRDLPPGSTSRLSLPMARVGGEWRIAGGLKDYGAMMSRSDFARYQSFAIPYTVPGTVSLVEDRRWFLTGPGLATRLARALVAPAPAYLQGAVTSGVPDYTELFGAVAVAGGTATVRLTERVSGADDSARWLLWARFVQTLSRVRGVERVDLVAGDARLSAEGLPDRPLASSDISLTTQRLRTDVAITRVGEQLTAVEPTNVGPDDDPRRAPRPRVSGVTALPRLPQTWYRLALATDASEIAAVGGDDAELNRWRGGKQIRIPRFATRLTRPAYDGTGTVWVGGRTTDGERVFALDTTAAGQRPVAPAPLNVPWLVGRRIVALEVAEDSSRIAVVSTAEDGTGTRLDIAGIVRRGRRPVSLAAPRELGSVLVDITDTTWVTPATLAVIGRRPNDATSHVAVVPLDARVEVLGEVADARTVTSLGTERSIAVVTGGHRVLLRSGNAFTPIMSSRELALPGR